MQVSLDLKDEMSGTEVVKEASSQISMKQRRALSHIVHRLKLSTVLFAGKSQNFFLEHL